MNNRSFALLWAMAICLIGADFVIAQMPATKPSGGRRLFEDLGQDEPGAEAPAPPPKPGNAPPPPAPGAAPVKPPAVKGRSIVFVSDVSESADAAAAVQRESKRAISSLPPGYQFRMLAARNGAMTSNSDSLAVMGDGKEDPARAAALKFAAEITPATQSEMSRLLPVAMTAQPNLLYLLVDRKSDLSRAYGLLKTLNAEKRTKVNVILFIDGQLDADKYNAAIAIARDQGGTFRRDYVKDPPPVVAAGSVNPQPGTGGPGVTPPIVKKPAPVEANGKPVDLLPLINLDRDVIDGVWTNKAGQLICADGINPKIRLPYKPPPQFDFVIEFTASEASEYSAASLLATDQLSNYGYFIGTGKNSVAGFGNINGRPPADNETALHSPNLIETGRRYRAVLKVRNDSITGWLDGKLLTELPPGLPGVALDRNWRVGCNAIGIGTSRKAIFHVVQIIGHEGKGSPVARYQPRTMRILPPFNPAKSISLTDREPIAVQTGWDRLTINSNFDNNEVIVRGKPCDRYIFAHAASSLLYQVPEGAVAFRAVGVKPAGKFNPKEGEFKYFVYIDGDEAFVSPSINESKGMIPIDVPIPKGAKQIELRVDKIRTNFRDHAVWAYPEFLMPR